MARFFGLRMRRRDRDAWHADLREQVARLTEAVERLERNTEQAAPSFRDRAVNVEHLHVERLDNLTFRLDKLDVKELSGTLNIGNNIRAADTDMDELLLNAELPESGGSPPQSDREPQRKRQTAPSDQVRGSGRKGGRKPDAPENAKPPPLPDSGREDGAAAPRPDTVLKPTARGYRFTPRT